MKIFNLNFVHFTAKTSFFKHLNIKDVHKMKNKPDLAILRTSYLSNEIEKITPKSHETIPLSDANYAVK
jgi:hypothetical protein